MATTGAAFTVKAPNTRLAVAPAISVAVTVAVNEPVTVGVPEIAPVEPLIVSPAGSPLADHPNDGVPPVAVTVVVV